MHLGDRDGKKGIYIINVVDEVTQFQHLGAVPRLSQHFLVPRLEALLSAFPFAIRAFHADNGSEYVNGRVAALLNKLHVGVFTKSRPRHLEGGGEGVKTRSPLSPGVLAGSLAEPRAVERERVLGATAGPLARELALGLLVAVSQHTPGITQGLARDSVPSNPNRPALRWIARAREAAALPS